MHGTTVEKKILIYSCEMEWNRRNCR